MVVAGRGEADLVPTAQVRLAEPLERAVLRHDLDERLQLRIAQAEVARLVRVGDHHHVRRIVKVAQTRVQVRQRREILSRDAHAVLRRAEEHVVVSAELVPGAPLVAEIGDEAPFLGVVGDVALHHLPLEVVGPDVVFRVGHEVEPGVFFRPRHETVRRADPFGEAGVPVGVAPVDGGSVRGDEDGVRDAGDAAVGRGDGDAVDARCVETHVAEHDDGVFAGGEFADALSVGVCVPRRVGPLRPVVEAVLGAHGEVERRSGPHHRWRKAVHAREVRAGDANGLDRQGEEVPALLEGDVEGERHAVAGEARHQQPAPAAGSVAVGDRHRVAGPEPAFGEAEEEYRGRSAEAAVHAGDGSRAHDEPRGCVGTRDTDEAVAARVVGLEGAVVPHEVTGDRNAAARGDCLRADRPGLREGRPGTGFEGPGLGAEVSESFGSLVEDGQLADEGVHAGQGGLVGRCGTAGDGRQVDGQVTAGHGIRVQPVPEDIGPLTDRVRVGGSFGDLGLQLLHAGAQVGLEVVRGLCGHPGHQRGGQQECREAVAGSETHTKDSLETRCGRGTAAGL